MAKLRSITLDAPPEYLMYILGAINFPDDVQELYITFRTPAEATGFNEIFGSQYIPLSIFASIHALRVTHRLGGRLGISSHHNHPDASSHQAPDGMSHSGSGGIAHAHEPRKGHTFVHLFR